VPYSGDRRPPLGRTPTEVDWCILSPSWKLRACSIHARVGSDCVETRLAITRPPSSSSKLSMTRYVDLPSSSMRLRVRRSSAISRCTRTALPAPDYARRALQTYRPAARAAPRVHVLLLPAGASRGLPCQLLIHTRARTDRVQEPSVALHPCA
jgi:hypothetical protein